MKKTVLKFLDAVVLCALLLAVSPAVAQWQTPNHSVPIGRGPGVTGFGSTAPGTAGQPIVSTGPTTDPAFGTIANSGLTAGAADTLKGSLNGTTVTDIAAPPCTAVNQAWRYTAGVGMTCGSVLVQTGFDVPINFGLSASVGGGALTLSVTTSNGGTPSSVSPVLVPFRGTTLTDGKVTWRTIASGLSLAIPSGASLGTSNSTPFRIWIFLDDNAGTPALGVATCSTSTAVFACSGWEQTLKTSVTMSAGATSAGTLYATAGVTLDAVRIVGFCEFASGLATAGTYSSSCTTLQVFGPGIKKPGDIVQSVRLQTGAVATGATETVSSDAIPSNSQGDQYISQAFTASATPNILRIQSSMHVDNGNGAAVRQMSLFSSTAASPTAALSTSYAYSIQSAPSLLVLDHSMLAATLSATTFTIRMGANTAGTNTFNGAAGARLYGGTANSYIHIQEIMG